MALWWVPNGITPTPNHTDILMFNEGEDQPPGRSIIRYSSWANVAPLSGNPTYDWSRILAAVIDEPYLNFMTDSQRNDTSNPCNPDDPRAADIALTADLLPLAAAALRSAAPLTRLWVNFNGATEANWMMEGACPGTQFNQSYIDVISVDKYGTDFDTSVEPFYQYVIDHPPQTPEPPHQQLALIPGTYSQPQDQTGYLQGYYDYANEKNQSCDLSLGSRAITGSFDGCRVWIVMGFPASNYTDHRTTYVGEVNSGDPLASKWRGEVALPLRSDLAAKQVSRGQTLQAILPRLRHK